MTDVVSFLHRRKLVLGGSVGALATLITLGESSSVQAASRPASHLGGFTRKDTLANCQQIAGSVFKSLGYTIWDTGKYFVVAASSAVSASVTLVPIDSDHTYVIVIANSSDSPSAENARNTIRSAILKAAREVPYGNDSVAIPVSN